MTTLIHPAPEEIMALLDGELRAEEARSISRHIAQCAECAAVRDEFGHLSRSLAAWAVPPVPEELDRAVEGRLVDASAKHRSARPRTPTPFTLRNWRVWAIGGGGAVFGALALVAIVAVAVYWSAPRAMQTLNSVSESDFALPVRTPTSSGAMKAVPAPRSVAPTAAVIEGKQSMPIEAGSVDQLVQLPRGVVSGAVPPPPPPAGGPLIARTVSLTVLVKNIPPARASLDAILAQHHGYAAQLTLNTPEEGARSFQSSLRIPASDLPSALDALRALGRVQTETQSGEEVTQQHTDLVARLTNARETEARLRAILQERSGKMQDVLDVEEKISETRGEIEQMEAEQKALEHRVDFATIDLQLTEVYKARLDGSAPSAGTEIRNSFVAGLRNAGGSLLALVLFLEEYGPSLLLWLAILGLPVWLVWRRYRQLRNSAD